MNNQFLQHLNSITPQGRAKDTKIFIPAEEIQEGSGSEVRTNRMRVSKNPNAQKRVQARDRARLARERMRAGLDPTKLGSNTQAGLHGGRTWAIKAEPHPVNVVGEPVNPGDKPYRAAARVPKAVLKYRLASKAKEVAAKRAKGIKPSGKLTGTAKKMAKYRAQSLAREAEYQKNLKKRTAISEGTKKPSPTTSKKVVRKLKRTGRSIKRAIKGLSNILSTPQDNVDYMMTGRKF
jgi:hypothetical protein